MGTRIRANCDSCGIVEVGPDSITLEVPLALRGEYRYELECDCGTVTNRPATPRIVAVLKVIGVSTRRPLTEEEIADFVAQLEATDYPQTQL